MNKTTLVLAEDLMDDKLDICQKPNRRAMALRYKVYCYRIMRLRIIDDDFMRKIFEERDCIQLVLQIIMNKPDLKVEDVQIQYDMKNLQGRSLKLDVLATDSVGKKYNIEIQRDSRRAGRKRARYHSSLLDANTLDAGEEFKNLPESYVIFITESDVLGKNLGVYHVERVIEETGETFGDESHIIYVNSKIQDDSELGKLMHDFWCTDADDMNYGVLADRVRYFKETEKGVSDMCEIMEEIRQEGIDFGIEQGTERGIHKINKLGKCLIEEGRLEDLVRSLSDSVYQNQLFEEFGIV